MDHHYKKIGRLTAGLVMLQALLVTLHLGHFGDVWPPGNPRHELGEFWPFSIYPMFSRGGHPWVRSLVREVADPGAPELWRTRTFDDLPGSPYALDDSGINQNDIANYIAKAPTWNAHRIAGIRSVFKDDLTRKNLLIYRVEGTIVGDSVSVAFVPFLLMAPDTTYFNPALTYPTD